jgi:hypothetical protein
MIENGKRPGHDHESIYGYQYDSPHQSPIPSRAGTPHSFSRAKSPGPTSPWTAPTPPLMEFGSGHQRPGEFSFPFQPSPRPSTSGGLGFQLQGHDSLPSRQSLGSGLSFEQYSAPPPPITRAPFGTMPSDEQIEQDVEALVASADLNTVSKKMLRQQLAQMYGLPDMSVRTIFVNERIERAVERQ